FFQAEDGIRDRNVTGVQTCALPISQGKARQLTDWSGFSVDSFSATADGKQLAFLRGNDHASVFVGDLADKGSRLVNSRRLTLDEIGRASCREREGSAGGRVG